MAVLKFEIVDDHWDELERRIRALHKQSVEVGVWSQEFYPDTEITYANLFAYHSHGDASRNIPPRDVLKVTFMTANLNQYKPLKKDLKKYFSNIDKKISTKQGVEKILSGVGKFYRDQAFSIFGSNKLKDLVPWYQDWRQEQGYARNEPLKLTGSLSKKIAYSLDGGITTYEYGM
ncbi:neck protein [Vibrio phage 1.170.O._10N.261.52.C3]|nr:neck protein [Vibrio phage 1.170.O._10N.261.52.C3]